ncbi:helix-turn-helix domain-containing protein [Myceligenerans salitolerans]|uniref:Helix-turn-helix transcriptional regulator n=1 Tax=Myceligenerans salitolerans TaxID=1230528 RepID=A0ABS3ICL2_9MICO|nr:helix-turn-helix transcriptional regulator [Myceligenerans salitolerans]MBO0610743.1 helix-turn-helix transcriptional regulator [Myceligenerans salitolerans]
MDDELIGKRIKQLRQARGVTQVGLAQEAKISLSLLRKIEQGDRDVSQPVAAAVGRVLRVDASTLTGQPYHREGSSPDRIHKLVPDLRRALNRWDLPPADPDLPPRPLDALTRDARNVSEQLQRGHNTQLAEMLPALLTEAFAMAHACDDDRDRAVVAHALLAYAHAAHTVAHQTGYGDLAANVEDRIQWIAGLTTDPAAAGFAAWMRTTSLMRDGLYPGALWLLDRVRTQVDPGRRDDGALLTVGALHLRSSLVAGRAGDLDAAMDHVEEARGIANHLGTDTDNDWSHLAFGPSNVAIYQVTCAVEAGDGPRALTLADRTRLPSHMLTRLPTRVSHHHLDLARAYFWQGRHDKALHSLMTARQAAPEQTRHHPTTREVTHLLVRAHRRGNEPLARFSAWLGPGDDADW